MTTHKIISSLAVIALSACASAILTHRSSFGVQPNQLRGVNIFRTTTPDDIKYLARNWGANSVRLLEDDLLSDTAPHKLDEKKLQDMFAAIDAATSNGLFVVIGLGVAM